MLFIFPEIPRLVHPCYLGRMGAPEDSDRIWLSFVIKDSDLIWLLKKRIVQYIGWQVLKIYQVFHTTT